MAPARGQKEITEPGFPGRSVPTVAPESGVLVRRNSKRILAVDIASQPVDRRLLLSFGGKGPEQTIPDDQNASMITVKIGWVGGVMNAVMGWRIEDQLDRCW